MSHISAVRRRQKGQALAEFALVAPVLFLLVLGVFEGGRFIYHYEALNNAAREGIRYAIIHGANSIAPTGPPNDATGADIKQAVADAAIGISVAGGLTIPDPVYSGPNGPVNKRGSTVSLSVNYTYDPVVPLLPPITISVEATGVVNN